MFPGVASSGFSGCSRVSADCSWFRVRDNLFIIITIGDGVELITTQQNWKTRLLTFLAPTGERSTAVQ